MQEPAFTIRDLKTYEEFLQVHGVQQKVWGFGEPGIGLYPPFLLTASKNGGVVLGAFDRENQMIGYVFSFLGREPGGPLKLCSQTMGVLAEWRNQGVATALKWAQRERTLADGRSLVTKYFDRGYVVTDFLTEGQGESRRTSYLLSMMTKNLQEWIGMG